MLSILKHVKNTNTITKNVLLSENVFSSQIRLKRTLHVNQSPLLIKAHELPPRPKFTAEMEKDIEESFLHGGRGPGGQKINKCNSKVQLKHIPSGIVITCQETRSRDKNRKIAREKLALKVAVWENGGEMIERQTKMIELKQQRKTSKLKKTTKKHELIKEQREIDKKLKLEEEEKILQTILASNQ